MLCLEFIDSEKAYDRVPREVYKWAFIKKKSLKNVYKLDSGYV